VSTPVADFWPFFSADLVEISGSVLHLGRISPIVRAPTLICSQPRFALDLTPHPRSSERSELDEADLAHAIDSTSRSPPACQ
jgi:hypothetical protein